MTGLGREPSGLSAIAVSFLADRPLGTIAQRERWIRYGYKELMPLGYAAEVEEMLPDMNYGRGEIYGGRWFRYKDSGKSGVWFRPTFLFAGFGNP